MRKQGDESYMEQEAQLLYEEDRDKKLEEMFHAKYKGEDLVYNDLFKSLPPIDVSINYPD